MTVVQFQRKRFARQAIPMVWDFAESNPFADAGGSFETAVDKGGYGGVRFAASRFRNSCSSRMLNPKPSARTKSSPLTPPITTTLATPTSLRSLYVRPRRSLRPIFPKLYATLAVPKAEELIATPYRHGSKQAAEVFFLDGMTAAMHNLAQQAHPAFPVTIYYAFKQSDTKDDGSSTHSTGWETFWKPCCVPVSLSPAPGPCAQKGLDA